MLMFSNGVSKHNISLNVLRFLQHFDVKLYNETEILSKGYSQYRPQPNHALGAYVPMLDTIIMNDNYIGDVTSLENDVVILHEIVHWSGASKRLARKGIVKNNVIAHMMGIFTLEDILFEELVACHGCVFLHQYLGLDTSAAEEYLRRYIAEAKAKTPNVDFANAEAQAKLSVSWLINESLIAQFRTVA